MADMSKKTDGPAPDSAEGYDASLLPDFDHEFVSDADLAAFANARNYTHRQRTGIASIVREGRARL